MFAQLGNLTFPTEQSAPQNNRPTAPHGQSAIPKGAGAIGFSDAEVIARQIANEELVRTQMITDDYSLGGHNDIYDAERHARLVYRMTVAIGSGWAGVFATGHEFQEEISLEPQAFIEMQMDLHNNSVGLNAAVNGSGIPTRSTPGLETIRGDHLVQQGC